MVEYVTSPDGTRIAFERSGSGPPMVLVHGTFADRTAWGLVRPAFEQRFTVFAMDRRGRPDSDPPEDHPLEREFEDVAAVIATADEPVVLVGHSYGAHCAMGGALLERERVAALVLYEPPTPSQTGADFPDEYERLMLAGDPNSAVEHFMVQVIDAGPEQVDLLKQTPMWQAFVKLAPATLVEMHALTGYEFAAERFSSLAMPVLLLEGSESSENLTGVVRRLAAVLPRAEGVVLDGQGHIATLTAPAMFTDAVLGFLRRAMPT